MAFSLLQFFTKPVRSVVGVDIGSSSIKIVQLRREAGRAVLETYGAIALGPYANIEIGRATQLPADTIATALKDVLKESNTTTAESVFAIPYASSLVSVVRLPAAVQGKLDQVMPLEARKYIPVPISEVQLDWSLVSGSGSGSQDKIEVMLVAIQNSVLEKYRAVATATALQVSFFEIEVFSAVRASLDHGIAPVAVVDMGAATTKFYVVERGIIRESHIINRGSQELTLNASRALGMSVVQAEESKRRVGMVPPSQPATIPGTHATTADAAHSFELSIAPTVAELSHTISSFEQRMGEAISTLVLTGGGAGLPGLIPYLQSRLQTEVRLADPFSKTQAPAFLEGVLKEAGPEFSVAVGIALRKLQELE